MVVADPRDGIGTTKAAIALEISSDTCRRLIRTGALAAENVQGRWVISPSEIRRYQTDNGANDQGEVAR